MRAAKAAHKDGEKVRKLLQKEDLIDFDYAIESDSSFVYFPLKKEIPERISKRLAIIQRKLGINPKKHELKQALSGELSKSERDLVNRSYDVIGSIAILDIPKELKGKEKVIARVLMGMNRNIKTVLNKRGIHGGEFRTQKLRYLAGERTKETTHKENGVMMRLDVEKVYFSPRLSTERKRIFEQVKKGENVLVMFSGCAPYPLVIAKNTQAREIIGVEKNPAAHKYGLEGIALNRIKNVKLICGDVRAVVPKLKRKFDRIIMPLPKDADMFLGTAFMAAKKGTVIHLYLFLDADKFEEGARRVEEIAREKRRKVKIIGISRCGQYSPTTFRMCIDFQMI